MGSHLILQRIPKNRKTAAFGQKKTHKKVHLLQLPTMAICQKTTTRGRVTRQKYMVLPLSTVPTHSYFQLSDPLGLDVISVASLVTLSPMDLSRPPESL